MKKTSYIMILLLSAGMVFWFFAPAILFKAGQPEKINVIKLPIGEKGKETVDSLPVFHVLDLRIISDNIDCYFEDESGIAVVPTIKIEESDTITSPTLALNNGWASVLRATVADSKLDIKLDESTLRKMVISDDKEALRPEGEETAYLYLKLEIPYGECCIGVLSVPRGMLTNLTNFGIIPELYDFREADMTVSTPNFRAGNCSFSSLVIE